MPMLPSGVFATSYATDTAMLRTRFRVVVLLAFLAFLATLPLWAPTALIAILLVIAVQVIAVLGLQITYGLGGQINLGQAAFGGVGAFVAASAAHNLSLPFFLTIPIGGLAGAAIAMAFAVPAARVKGFYLALTTLAAQVIFTVLVPRLPDKLFGGFMGLPVTSPEVLGFRFDTDVAFYYLAVFVSGIMTVLALNVARSRLGRALIAIRDNENAAGIVGVDVFRYKVLSFGVGGFFAGVSGALWLYYVRLAAVDMFTLAQSIFYLAMIIIGGVGSVLGAILGVVVVRGIDELMTRYGADSLTHLLGVGVTSGRLFALTLVVVNLVFLFVLVWEPRGLAYRWRCNLRDYIRLWPYPY